MSANTKEENLLESSRSSDDQGYDNLTSPTFETAEAIEGETPVYNDPVERERQMLEWKEELLKVEGEIATLRQVLGTKVRYASELKRKMGITPFQEFKADMATSLEHIRESEGYQKTSGIVKTASEKTTSAISAVGATVSRKLGDIKNSQTFKSLEERVEHTYTNVKGFLQAKVTGSKSTNGLNEELREEPEQDSASLITSPSGPLPEEKVPLN